MHRWLLLLMIALLPVRTWAGDVMAVSMWNAPASATMVAAPCHGGMAVDGSVEPAAKSHHGAGPMTVADYGSEAEEPLNDACAACDVCNGPAMMLAMPDACAEVRAHLHVDPLVEHFVSAEAQRTKKPPIA